MDSNAPLAGKTHRSPEERDSIIAARVRAYLKCNKDKVDIDVREMADYLQKYYLDFQSLKSQIFIEMVQKAYLEITHKPKEVEVLPAKNKQTDVHHCSWSADLNKELIDISSDDEVTSCTTRMAIDNKTEGDMEIELVQVSKKPHLSSSIEMIENGGQQELEDDACSNFSSKTRRSRKRRRGKNTEGTLDSNVRKKKAKEFPVVNSKVKFSDVGGCTKVLETVAQLLIPMKHPEIYSKLGSSPPSSFLLQGPPGCGKTLIVHAIAGELNMPLLKVSGTELVVGVESQQRVTDLFDQAIAIAPCILFIDELDTVSPREASAQTAIKKRIVSQLISSLDGLAQKSENNVIVIGATNKPDYVDPALRRAGRFLREISLGILDRAARASILEVHTAEVAMSPLVNLHKIASLTTGFVGADLVALIREAAIVAVSRTFQEFKKNTLTDSAVNEDENEKQPVLNEELENPDVIIEDDPLVILETNATEKSDGDKTDILCEVITLDIPATEEQKTAEDTPNILEPAKSPPTEPIAPSLSDASRVATEEIQPELTALTEITDVPISSPKEKKSEEKEAHVSLLTWLQNDSPLTLEQLALLCIEESDFEVALKNVQSFAKRQGFVTIPNVTWEDIGALQDIRQELQMTILAPIKYSERFDSFGLNAPTGVLLCGPPGCGKTLLAKAIANEADVCFISVKASNLLNTNDEESEKAVRRWFSRARNSAPCIIFFDELDVLCPRRPEGDNTTSTSTTHATSRVVNQMLTEMDGIAERKDIFLMAASNRPDFIDLSVLRPGRLEKILYVGLPNALDRVDILRALTKNGTKPQLAKDISLEEIAEKSEGYTGADLAALVREACFENLREAMNGLITPAEIYQRHFHAAFDKVSPSVQDKDIKHYDKLQKLFSVKRSQHLDMPMALDPPIDTIMEAMET